MVDNRIVFPIDLKIQILISAGQTVNGKVVFTFDSPKKIRGNF